MTWGAWGAFDRSAVRGAIEEATAQPLSVDDPLPDTLIASAEAIGLDPIHLRIWIYDQPHRWSTAELTRWARRMGFTREAVEPGATS